ncbi:MAG: hypothetical protein KDA93_17675 [Planctomycetaceae bacterium]|nr:hypothetical protein [Planctomycetaceae bacterium]
MLSKRLRIAAVLCVGMTASAAFADGPSYGGAAGGGAYGSNQYPVLNAPLYSSPVQHVPEYAGGSVITNQALAPHEMLYPHEYHAMYGPFYYRVNGVWVVTPFGVRQHEKWQLQGTHVKVRYHDHFRLFSSFHPPVSH